MDEKFFELIIKESKGEITREESADLESIKNQNEEYAQSYEQVKQLWMDSGKIKYISPEQKAKDWTLLSGKLRSARPSYAWRVAASVALLIGFLSLMYYSFLYPYKDFSHYHAVHAPLNLQLADGSKIELNTGSEIYVSDQFNQEDRKLILKGEAFFEVAKNPSLPFEVTAGESRTTVLGTTFNLWQQKDQTLLTVLEGLVRFGSEMKNLEVAAKQSARLVDEDVNQVHPNRNQLSWRTGLLVFNNTAIEQVIQDLEHHYQIQINWQAMKQNEVLTTQFEDASLEEVMEELSLLLDVKITQDGQTFTIR